MPHRRWSDNLKTTIIRDTGLCMNAIQSLRQMNGNATNRRRWAWLGGWSLSVATHAALLIVFAGVTWLSGRDVAPQETEVAITTGGEIAIEETPLINHQYEPLGVESPGIQSLADVAPIRDLAGGVSASKGMPVIGLSEGGSMSGDWSQLAAAGGGGGSSGASFFGLRARGRKFVYVVDYSGSMRGDRFAAAKRELVRSITALDRGMQFFIVFYNQAFLPMPAEGLVRATAKNKQRFLEWVRQAQAGGGTDPRDAMRFALKLKPNAIWLLSDGEFAAKAGDEIRGANRGRRIQIHTIAFHSNKGEAVLRRIANDNRGKYRFVPAK